MAKSINASEMHFNDVYASAGLCHAQVYVTMQISSQHLRCWITGHSTQSLALTTTVEENKELIP